jgi:hypothetical protein
MRTDDFQNGLGSCFEIAVKNVLRDSFGPRGVRFSGHWAPRTRPERATASDYYCSPQDEFRLATTRQGWKNVLNDLSGVLPAEITPIARLP